LPTITDYVSSMALRSPRLCLMSSSIIVKHKTEPGL
jgi:hypothetical protein